MPARSALLAFSGFSLQYTHLAKRSQGDIANAAIYRAVLMGTRAMGNFSCLQKHKWEHIDMHGVS